MEKMTIEIKRGKIMTQIKIDYIGGRSNGDHHTIVMPRYNNFETAKENAFKHLIKKEVKEL